MPRSAGSAGRSRSDDHRLRFLVLWLYRHRRSAVAGRAVQRVPRTGRQPHHLLALQEGTGLGLAITASWPDDGRQKWVSETPEATASSGSTGASTCGPIGARSRAGCPTGAWWSTTWHRPEVQSGRRRRGSSELQTPTPRIQSDGARCSLQRWLKDHRTVTVGGLANKIGVFGDAVALGAELSASLPKRVLVFAVTTSARVARRCGQRRRRDLKPVLGGDLLMRWPLIQEVVGPRPYRWPIRRTEAAPGPASAGACCWRTQPHQPEVAHGCSQQRAAGPAGRGRPPGDQRAEPMGRFRPDHLAGCADFMSTVWRRPPRSHLERARAPSRGGDGQCVSATTGTSATAAGMNDHIAKPVDIHLKLFRYPGGGWGAAERHRGCPARAQRRRWQLLVTSAVASAERTPAPCLCAVQLIRCRSKHRQRCHRDRHRAGLTPQLSDVVLARHPPDLPCWLGQGGWSRRLTPPAGSIASRAEPARNPAVRAGAGRHPGVCCASSAGSASGGHAGDLSAACCRRGVASPCRSRCTHCAVPTARWARMTEPVPTALEVRLEAACRRAAGSVGRPC